MSNALIVNGLGEVFVNDQYIAAVSSIKITPEMTSADVQRAFNEALLSHVPDHAELIRLIWDAQAEFNNDQCRVQHWAGETRVGVEFKWFDDEGDLRAQVYAVAADLSAEILILDQSVHVDKFMPSGATAWQYGKDHGRPYTQVELSIPIKDPTMEKIKKAFEDISLATFNIFQATGVGVL